MRGGTCGEVFQFSEIADCAVRRTAQSWLSRGPSTPRGDSLRESPYSAQDDNFLLFAGGVATYSGYRQAEIFVGVYWDVVDSYFVVEMGASGTPARSHVTDGVATVDVLPGGDGEAGEMAVAGGDAVAVVEHDGAPVASEEVGEGDGAVGGSDHGRAYVGGDVDAGVEGAFSIKGIDALTERSGDLAFDGPEVGSGIGANPIGGGGILGEAERDANAGGAGQCGVLKSIKLIER